MRTVKIISTLLNRTNLISSISEKAVFDFDKIALQVFNYQYKYNTIYQNWVDSLDVNPNQVVSVQEIPFLPISAFKNYRVQTGQGKEEMIFTSSGTTGAIPSKHYVWDQGLYLENSKRIFESFYGATENYCFLALLPSYLERSGSSLVAMVDHFIQLSQYDSSGFYLYNHDDLYRQLMMNQAKNIPTILFGVSFALIDFVAERKIAFPELIIIETGGMKGRKKELTREELHKSLADGFGVASIHSEYGMTELFSQAYSKKSGVYTCGATMKVIIKDISDPLEEVEDGKTGIVNVIDLANIDSCSFIETQDLGRISHGTFEILGRLDTSDIRGCNLMVGDL